MESLERYVEARTEFNEAEKEFKNELCDILGIKYSNIKESYIYNKENGSKVIRMLVIELRGCNEFKSEDVAKIEGLIINSCNTLEINCGEIHL